MAASSTWSVLRKRVAPVAFLIALVALAGETCRSEAASVELVFDPGEARSQLSSLRVDVYRPGDSESLAYFEGRPGPRMRWQLQLDPGDYRLGFRASMTDGSVRRFERTIIAENNAVISLSLARSLAPGDQARE